MGHLEASLAHRGVRLKPHLCTGASLSHTFTPGHHHSPRGIILRTRSTSHLPTAPPLFVVVSIFASTRMCAAPSFACASCLHPMSRSTTMPTHPTSPAVLPSCPTKKKLGAGGIKVVLLDHVPHVLVPLLILPIRGDEDDLRLFLSHLVHHGIQI